MDKNHQFMTQRQHPSMALISPRLETHSGGDGDDEERDIVTLQLSAPGMPDISTNAPPSDSPTENIRYDKYLL